MSSDGIGRVPQVASSWFDISSHLFGFPRPEDETLLNFPNSAPGQVSLVGESVPEARVFPSCDMSFESESTTTSTASSDRCAARRTTGAWSSSAGRRGHPVGRIFWIDTSKRPRDLTPLQSLRRATSRCPAAYRMCAGALVTLLEPALVSAREPNEFPTYPREIPQVRSCVHTVNSGRCGPTPPAIQFESP